MIHVAHVITGLDRGGAETTLLRLVGALSSSDFRTSVISLGRDGSLVPAFRELGVTVTELGLSPRGLRAPVDAVAGVRRLRRLLSDHSPDLVQTWMDHANLIGGLAARSLGLPVAWNIRSSDVEDGTRLPRRFLTWTCAALSRWVPRRIACVSESARLVHHRLGYPKDRCVVIENGLDAEHHRPDAAARGRLLSELELPADTLLVGAAGRHAPMKGHAVLLEAFALLRAALPTARLVLCGDGITWDNPELAARVRSSGLDDHVHLLGRRDDLPTLLPALDVFVSSSVSTEGFPNVVAEAMACGVPAVVTDVGDARRIVGDTGRVVAPRDPAALATGLGEMLDLGDDAREELGRHARRRIVESYSLDRMVAAYVDLHRELTDA